jgi:CheY-like chemotaxis protein
MRRHKAKQLAGQPETTAARAGAQRPDEVRRSSGVRSTHSGGLVLLVEDDPLVARMFGRLLGQAGLSVRVARSGQEALAALEDGAEPAVVWTDLQLGRGPDGVDVLQAAARCSWQPTLLLVTGDPDHDRARELPDGATVVPKAHASDAIIFAALRILERGED